MNDADGLILYYFNTDICATKAKNHSDVLLSHRTIGFIFTFCFHSTTYQWNRHIFSSFWSTRINTQHLTYILIRNISPPLGFYISFTRHACRFIILSYGHIIRFLTHFILLLFIRSMNYWKNIVENDIVGSFIQLHSYLRDI